MLNIITVMRNKHKKRGVDISAALNLIQEIMDGTRPIIERSGWNVKDWDIMELDKYLVMLRTAFNDKKNNSQEGK